MVTRRTDLEPTRNTDMRKPSSSFHELCAFMHPLSQDSAREQAWQIGGLRHAVSHLLSHFPRSGTSCLGLVSFQVVAAVVCWLSCCRPIDNSLSKAPMLGSGRLRSLSISGNRQHGSSCCSASRKRGESRLMLAPRKRILAEIDLTAESTNA